MKYKILFILSLFVFPILFAYSQKQGPDAIDSFPDELSNVAINQECIRGELYTIPGNEPFENRSISPGCFAGETLVDTPDGSKRIDELNPGDKVFAWDHEQDKLVISEVEGIKETKEQLVCTLSLSNGDSYNVTPEHPFYSIGGSEGSVYRSIAEIAWVNSFIENTLSLHYVYMLKLPVWEKYWTYNSQVYVVSYNNPQQATVYNLSVKKYNNFFVNGILVHNKASIE